MNHQRFPWSTTDVAASYVASVVGITLVLLGWYGASGSGDLGTQLAWVNVGGAGVLVAATANVLWLTSGRRRTRARERDLLARAAVIASRTVPPATDDVLVAVADGTRAHRPGCVLVRGKRAVAVSGDRHQRCEACTS